MKRPTNNHHLPYVSASTAVAASAALLAISMSPISAAVPQPAPVAVNGVYVSILDPTPGASFSGDKQISIDAYYQAPSTTGGIGQIDLIIDGKVLATKRLNSPEPRGVITFLLDPTSMPSGSHQVVVRATAVDQEVSSSRTSLTMASADPGSSIQLPAPGAALNGPDVAVTYPRTDASVQGTVTIHVKAHDVSGKPPYVSLFIDHAFKSLQNYPPFTFTWDTTRVSNGKHEIEAYGYNDAAQVGTAQPIDVNVNNPGGNTFERTDLSDATVSSTQSPAARHAASPAATLARHTAAPVAASPELAAVASERHAARVAAPTQLASAKIDGWQQRVNDESVLTAPAVEQQTAVASSAESAAANVPAQLAMDFRSQPISFSTHNQVASAQINDSLQPGVESVLSSPAVRMQSPAAQHSSIVAAARPLIKPTYTVSSRPMSPEIATVAKYGPVNIAAGQQMASANITPEISPFEQAELDAPSVAQPSALVATKQAVIAVEKPLIAVPAQHVAAVSAAPTRIASATINPDLTATWNGSLSTPVVEVPASAVRSAELAAGRLIFDRHVISHVRGSYQVVMNSQPLSMDRPLQAHGSILFAPLRQIFESQGGALYWIPTGQEVRGISPNHNISIKIGSRRVVVNNTTHEISEAPYLLSGRTMIPLSFLPVALNVVVSYDAATGHLDINSR